MINGYLNFGLLILILKLCMTFCDEKVYFKVIETKTRTLVSKNGIIDSLLLDINDMYLEVISPQSISYTYTVRMAKNFGSSFPIQYFSIPLLIASPFDGCSEIKNSYELSGRVALMIRG
jgi:hypothetical protein